MITKAGIVEMLKTNDKAVARALVLLNDRQTSDEQRSESVRYQNGRGFRPCHARMGTSMANFYSKFNRLSPKQLAYWRALDKAGNMRIGIYAGQLLEEAQLKAQKTMPKPKPVGDIGNLLEEQMVIEERLSNLDYDIDMAQDSDDPVIMSRMFREQEMLQHQLENIRDELEEAARMDRKFAMIA